MFYITYKFAGTRYVEQQEFDTLEEAEAAYRIIRINGLLDDIEIVKAVN